MKVMGYTVPRDVERLFYDLVTRQQRHVIGEAMLAMIRAADVAGIRADHFPLLVSFLLGLHIGGQDRATAEARRTVLGLAHSYMGHGFVAQGGQRSVENEAASEAHHLRAGGIMLRLATQLQGAVPADASKAQLVEGLAVLLSYAVTSTDDPAADADLIEQAAALAHRDLEKWRRWHAEQNALAAAAPEGSA